MNEFFDKLGNAARRVASGVSTEVSVAALEQKVKDAQRILGGLYFKAVTEGQAPQGPEFEAQVDTIARLQEEIRLKRQSHEVDG